MAQNLLDQKLTDQLSRKCLTIYWLPRARAAAENGQKQGSVRDLMLQPTWRRLEGVFGPEVK